MPVVPDAFLSLGVERRKNEASRGSYVTWEENDIAPILALEIVSQTPGGEYDKKQEIYRKLGVLYYRRLPAPDWRAFLDARDRSGNWPLPHAGGPTGSRGDELVRRVWQPLAQ